MQLLSFRDHIVTTFVSWKEALSDRSFRFKLLLVPGLFFVYSAITQRLGNYIETRTGVQLEDKLLTFFPSIDFSMPVFALLYISLIILVLTHLDQPKVILRIIEMHFAVAVVRQVCILLVALEPPSGIIVLRDVFLENTIYPHNTPLTKDLFFSGHVASIWIYFLCARRLLLKVLLGFATLIMGYMILCMRVHYTYDVYGAVFFTSLIYFMPVWVRAYYASKQALVTEVESESPLEL